MREKEVRKPGLGTVGMRWTHALRLLKGHRAEAAVSIDGGACLGGWPFVDRWHA